MNTSDSPGLSLAQAIQNINNLSIRHPENNSLLKERLQKLLNAIKFPSILKVNSADTAYSFPRTQNEIERKRVDDRLRGFSMNDSIAWKDICQRFGPNLNQTELLSIAEVICLQVQLKVDREAKRRKEVLIKWFDENFAVIKPVLDLMVLEDENGSIIDANHCDSR